MAKYSFLLPAYKGSFLDKMLSSIQGQTYTDFKVVISDDCSPENLKSICEPYLIDTRFTYRRNERNMGVDGWINHGNLLVNLCETKYCIIASDDDVYEPTFLEEIDKLVIKYPECAIFHARTKVIDENGDVCLTDPPYFERVSQLEFISQYEYFNHIECAANYVYKTDIIKKYGGFVNFPLGWVSETATNFALAKDGCVNTRNILFSFRMSGINISSERNEKPEKTRKKFHAVLMFETFFEKLLKDIEVNNREEEMLLKTVKDYHKYQHIKNAACYYSSSITFMELTSFIKDFNDKGYFFNKYEICQLFKRWLLKRL